MLAAGLCYSLGGIYIRQLNDYSMLVVVCGTLIAASVWAIPGVLLFDYPVSVPSQLPVLGAVLGLALLGTAGAYFVFLQLIRSAGTTNTLLVTFLVPITALLLGLLVLGEALCRQALLGMFVIFCGLVFVDGRLLGVAGRLRSKFLA